MKQINTLFCLLFFSYSVFTQNGFTTNWKADLEYLKKTVIQKEYLFKELSKIEFNNQINKLEKELPSLKNEAIYWRFHQLISSFKNQNLKVIVEEQPTFSFETKWFKNGIYITKLPKEQNYVLGEKLIAINNIPINKIIQKVLTVSYYNKASIKENYTNLIKNKSLLEFLNITTNDSIQLTVISKNQEKITINIPYVEIINEDMISEIIPNKIPFYKTKNNSWFWSYGINFGKQVYFKYTICLSKEYIKKMNDSLAISNKAFSKTYTVPLLQIRNAPSINEITEKIVRKFDKKRYGKLIIDFRGNQIGSVLTSKKLIHRISTIKRINKKGKIFILTDRAVSSAAIATILAFKKDTKVVVIGEEIVDSIDDTNQLDSFYLPNSKLKVQFPKSYIKENTVIPNILIEPTFEHYKNGVDILLQKALEY